MVALLTIITRVNGSKGTINRTSIQCLSQRTNSIVFCPTMITGDRSPILLHRTVRFVFLREILCILKSPDELEREILSEGNLTVKFFLTRRHWRNIVEPCCNLLRLVPTMKNVTVHRVLSPMRGFFSLPKDKRREEVNPASIPYVKSCAPIGTHEYFIFVVQPRSRR